MLLIHWTCVVRSGVCIQLFVSLYCATILSRRCHLGPCLILLWLQVQRRNMKWRVSWGITSSGEQWNTWCTGVVMIKQRIVGSQSKISSMYSIDFTIVQACSQASLRLYIRWDLTCLLDFVSSLLWYQIGHYCTELYRTYAPVYMGFAIVCFDVLCSQGGPLLVSLSLCEVAWVLRGFTANIGI